MSTYDVLRHFADSWGLLAMVVMWVVFVGWAFRRGAQKHNEAAANMIFKEDDNG